MSKFKYVDFVGARNIIFVALVERKKDFPFFLNGFVFITKMHVVVAIVDTNARGHKT